jgi:peptidoglycan/LPS O-acetylase OafA/YrhL
MKLKSIEIIESKSRISSVDIFRGFAILPVVLFHFNNTLPFGYLGVDLFFVISGLLVGSILITQYKSRNKINFFQFVLQRGFKIWPSYYSFFIVGTILGMVLLEGSPKWEVFRWGKDLFRYLFFYQNYTGKPFHWSFDHVWSLCIEEHFYILLPILFIITAIIFRNNFRMLLFRNHHGLIVTGILYLNFSAIILHLDFETYSATHNRIDALGWGVLIRDVSKIL